MAHGKPGLLMLLRAVRHKIPGLLALLIGCGTLHFLSGPLAAAPSKNDSRAAFAAAEFDSHLRSCLKEEKLVGAAVAVVHKDRIIHLKGYGLREADKPEPIDPHTVFRIASVSKGFASTLTALLVRDKILDWEDPVSKYVPDFALKDSSHTRLLNLRHVLSHTSGIVPHAYDNLIEAGFSHKDLLAELRNALIICPVGECYGYQNIIYSLIADIVLSAVGKTYASLVRERIFLPLQMKDASVGWEGLQSSGNRATAHVRRQKKWKPIRDREHYYTVSPAAGVNASIMDMAQWLQAQMGNSTKTIPKEVLDLTHKPVARTRGERRRFNRSRRLRRADYGLGWRIFDYAGHTMIFHSGGVRGFFAQIAFLPEDKVGIVILTNSSRKSLLYSKFFDAYFGL